MKILCLSDLHLKTQEVIDIIDLGVLTPFLMQLQGVVAASNPDVVVVTGDSVVPAQVRLLSALFGKLVSAEIPIVLTLGNHEFWGMPFEETLEKLKEQTVSCRRACLTFTLYSAKPGGDPTRSLEWAARMTEDQEWFIQKSIAWYLRQLSKHDTLNVTCFLSKYGKNMKSFAIREVSKYLKSTK